MAQIIEPDAEVGDIAEAPEQVPGDATAHDGLFIDTAGFDAVAMEIAATLMFLGVPERERDEVNSIIESYRHQVVQSPAA